MTVDTQFLSELEDKHNLPSGLLHAVMNKESAGDANAESPKGAKGWFQFMPATATAYGVTDPTDFRQSASGAARYLSDLKARFAGDLPKTLAAYNAGPTAVVQHNGVPPYPETQNYVQDIMGKVAGSAPPDISDLPPDISELDEQAGPWGGETTSRPAQPDYQGEMAKHAGVAEQVVGGIGGAIVGGAAGNLVAPGVGTATGGFVGGGLGTFLGTLAGISRAERDGTLTQIPTEQKLAYALKQTNLNLATTLGTMGVATALPLVMKFFRPEEASAVEEFFRNAGLSNVRPEIGKMASYSVPEYRAAAKDMNAAVDKAIQTVASDQAAAAGAGPTRVGTMFQDALSQAMKNVSAKVEPLYGFAKRGTVAGDSVVHPTTDTRAMAKGALTEIGAQNSSYEPTIMKTLNDLSSGKPVSVADAISLKRGVADATDFKSPDSVSKSLDQKTKTELLSAIDDMIDGGLFKFPGANTAFRLANKIYGESMSDLRSKMMMQMAQKDPLSVADYVARNATPTVLNDFESGLTRMMQTGAMNLKEANQIRSGMRQNWITQNLKSPDDAAKLADALSGKMLDPMTVETFNYVMRGAPQGTQAAIEAAAAASAAAKTFAGNIPQASQVGAGAYATTAAAGGIIGSSLGLPGQAGGAMVAMAGLRLVTQTIPKALAKAAMNNDTAMINQIRRAATWYADAAGKGGAMSQVPAGIYQAIQYIENKAD